MKTFALGCLLLMLGSCILLSSGDSVSHATKARALKEQGKIDEAIAEYQKHIEARLEDSRRPEDENPYFYEIYIGDLYLQKGDPNEALQHYQTAQTRGVEMPLVSFRIREVAKSLRQKGDYRGALKILQQYRSLDEFPFDADIDETSKEMVEREDQLKQKR